MAESHSSYVKTVWMCALVTAVTIWGAPSKAPAAPSDAEVMRIFRDKLAKSKLSAEGIQIRVQAGVATITGKTDVLQHKGTATRMAKSSGAREVRNQMMVSDSGKRVALERLNSGRKSATPAKPVGSPSPASKQPPAGETKAPAPAGLAPPPVRRAQVKHE